MMDGFAAEVTRQVGRRIRRRRRYLDLTQERSPFVPRSTGPRCP
jgi:hypothetical protein